MPRLNALRKHWERYPPVHVTAALLAGIKPQTAPKPIANAWQAFDVINDSQFAAAMAPKPGTRTMNMRLPK